MESFPAFFPLKGARVVIAGSGEPAEARARLFAGSPAEIVRLDEAWGLDPDSYQGAHLIFIASHDEAFAQAAEVAARTAGAPVNVFDRPALSDFNTPAIVDRGAVVVAVATSGAAPLLAQMLRAEIESRLPADVGQTAERLGARREAIKAAFPDLVRRRAFLRAVLAEAAPSEERLDAALSEGLSAVGKIVLIDMPAADDLISLRAARALGAADVVVAPHDATELLARHARRDAVRLEEAEAPRLIELARDGQIVAVVGAPPGLAGALDGVAVDNCRAAPDE
ncbi:MAG TPA: bifunctional precorrin-2 dehydrogenase/sirohydrochlorin ferrochelatase [Caulobacteraceae bacterium]